MGLKLDNLLLLNVEPQSFSDDVEKFKNAYNFLHIKGCRRSVLVGNLSALDAASQLNQDGVTVYQKAEAYAHLLSYVTGLLSRTRGENQIVSQFKKSYEELREINSNSGRELSCIYQSILHDNALVRKHVTHDLKPAFYEACAHELSDPYGQESILVMAGANKQGGPDTLTENVVRYLGSKRRRAARVIAFTHPDEDVLRNVQSHFLRKKAKKQIVGDVQKVPFEVAFDSARDLQNYQKVFVCHKMGQDTDVDEKMISEWQEREVLGGTLVHLGGNAKSDRRTDGAWADADLWRYVSPEDIIARQIVRKAQNDEAIMRGSAACGACAEIRMSGQRPTAKRILTL